MMNNMTTRKGRLLTNSLGGLLGASLLGSAAMSHAAVETEVNDLFALADAAGPGFYEGIIGDLTAVSNDVDIWSFDLTANAGMGVSISNGAQTDYNGFDPLIVLFMQDGGNYYPVAANDPWSFGTSFSFTPWQSGSYFLTVSAFGNSPQDFFNNNQYDSQFWSDNYFGLGTAFDHFEGQSSSSFDYQLSFNGTVAAPSPIPLPAAVWLFGSGVLGLLGFARRRNRAD